MKDDMRFVEGVVSTRRVAVLVDGENLSADHAAAILATARAEGRADILRVYGNAKSIPAWDAQPGFRLIHSGTGKNATDVLLAIDAMELAFGGGIDTFLIASSDRDFAHVAHRLRERGIYVIGMGEQKTPDSFRAACTRFVTLVARPKPVAVMPPTLPDSLLVISAPVSSPPRLPEPVNADPVTTAIRETIIAAGSAGAGMPLKLFGSRMGEWRKSNPGVALPKQWRSYLEQRPDLYKLDPKGNNARIRLV